MDIYSDQLILQGQKLSIEIKPPHKGLPGCFIAFGQPLLLGNGKGACTPLISRSLPQSVNSCAFTDSAATQ